MPKGVYQKTEVHKEKISIALKQKGINPRMYENWKLSKGMKGKKHSEQAKIKIGLGMKGKNKGENHPRWIKDRNSLIRRNRSESKSIEWRTAVFTRDNFKCKISNNDCKGQLEAHHILRWSRFLELRYEVNNGITLCHFHHPRKINDEMKLSPYFQELVKN